MINPLGPVPTPLDSAADFNTKAFGLLAQLPGFVTETNATADTIQINADILAAVLLGMAFPEYTGTSTSSVTVGTGPKVFATQTGKLWVPGQIVVVSSGGNILRGPVVSYMGGNLTLNVTSTVGSGTYTSWTIGLTFEGLLLARSGDNNDITKLSGLTSPIPRANTLSIIQSLPNPSLAANAMTLPASTHALDFRSPTLSDGLPTSVSGTAAALTIPAGATLGTVSGQQSTIVEVIINNGGALEKAVVNLAGGNDLSEAGVINTTAISAGATAANVFYSNTARTGVPYRVVRAITSTQATAGQWTTALSVVQGQGGQAFSAMSSIGYGQTPQAVTRVKGATYYNKTGKPITLIIQNTYGATSLGAIGISFNGGPVLPFAGAAYTTAAGGYACGSITIPIDASYVLSDINALGGTLTAWEIR